MSRAKIGLCLLSVLLLLSPPSARAGDERAAAKTLEVTKGVSGSHSSPEIAVDPSTGDVLVAWTRATSIGS